MRRISPALTRLILPCIKADWLASSKAIIICSTDTPDCALAVAISYKVSPCCTVTSVAPSEAVPVSMSSSDTMVDPSSSSSPKSSISTTTKSSKPSVFSSATTKSLLTSSVPPNTSTSNESGSKASAASRASMASVLGAARSVNDTISPSPATSDSVRISESAISTSPLPSKTSTSKVSATAAFVSRWIGVGETNTSVSRCTIAG